MSRTGISKRCRCHRHVLMRAGDLDGRPAVADTKLLTFDNVPPWRRTQTTHARERCTSIVRPPRGPCCDDHHKQPSTAGCAWRNPFLEVAGRASKWGEKLRRVPFPARLCSGSASCDILWLLREAA